MMMNLGTRVKRGARALHRDERGADLIEYVLIIAAIALPLLGVIIWFWKDLSRWVGELYEDIRGGGYQGTDPDDL